MKEDVKIRKATVDDLPALHQNIQEIARTERPWDDTIKEGFIEYYKLQQLLTDAQCLVVVAEINNEVVASGLAQIREAETYNKHKQYAHLGAMYVQPSQRGKGINQQIINELKQFAVSRGITELRLDVYPENAPAIKAYEKAGFAPHMLKMRMRL